MSTSARGLHYTYAEYLSLEQHALVRHEYLDHYDRGQKLRHYQSLPSVQEVLIASHREPRLTLHRRAGDRWTLLTASRGGSLTLDSLAAEIGVDELYEGLEEIQ